MDAIEFKNYLISDIFKPLFKDSGFTVSGIHFRKEEEGFIKIFNIQSSQFNLSHHAGFYFNMGFFFPYAYSFRFRDFLGEDIEAPKKPKETDCQVRFRSDELTKRLGGYNIDLNTNRKEFEDLVIKDIKEFLLPFYNSIKTLNDLVYRENVTFLRGILPYAGLTFAHLGNLEKASEIIKTYLKHDIIRDERWHKKIEKEAQKMNIKI